MEELVREYERAVHEFARTFAWGHDILPGFWASEAERLYELILAEFQYGAEGRTS